MSHRRLLPLLCFAWALSGCAQNGGSSWLSSSGNRLAQLITPYRIEIVQGNVVTKEQAARVSPGMTRYQVRDVLGSPLLADVFHADRWDYVFTIRRQGVIAQRQAVVAHFEGDVLKSLEVPDALPTEAEFVASINPFKPRGAEPKLALTEAERAKLPRPPARSASAAAAEQPQGPQRTYPPLDAQP